MLKELNMVFYIFQNNKSWTVTCRHLSNKCWIPLPIWTIWYQHKIVQWNFKIIINSPYNCNFWSFPLSHFLDWRSQRKMCEKICNRILFIHFTTVTAVYVFGKVKCKYFTHTIALLQLRSDRNLIRLFIWII